nr:hypothetical protein [Haloferula luteola]
MALEDLMQLVEIGNGTREAVEPIDNDGLNMSRLDVRQQLLERRAIRRSPRIATVLVNPPQ